ncbi:MAG TPA: hypothetical protein VF648_08405 [Pyrinomonadaceae bacterium]|jgi:hypothetical protein
MIAGVVLRYSDLFDEKASLQKLRKLVKQFDGRFLITQLSTINSFLSAFAFGNDDEKILLQKRLVANFIAEDVLENKIKVSYGNESPANLPIFTRLTISYLTRLCILNYSESSNLIPDGKQKGGYQLGLCCLIANDYLTTEKEEIKLNSRRAKTIQKHLALQIAPLLEFYNPIKLENGIFRFQKILFETAKSPEFTDFLKRNPNRTFNLEEKFRSATGLSLENYRDYTIATLSFLLPNDITADGFSPVFKRQNFISKSLVPQEKFDAYLNLEAKSVQSLKEELRKRSKFLTAWKFQQLKVTPLIEIEPETYTAIDSAFITEKLGQGGYWKINDCLNGADREKFKSYFGDLFEFYTNKILNQIASKQPIRGGFFVTNAEYKNGGECFDAMMYFPNSKHLIVFEHKASLLQATSKYSGSVRRFEKELKEKFVVDKKGKPRGVGQLAKHIENLFHKDKLERRVLTDKPLQEMLSKVEKISPVIIGLESFLKLHIIEGVFLSEYFKNELKEKKNNIAEGIRINPLTVIHIEELENLKPYLEKGDATFEQLLNLRFIRDPEYKRFFALSTFFEPDFRLLKENGKNEEVWEYFDRIFEESKKNLFGENYEI